MSSPSTTETFDILAHARGVQRKQLYRRYGKVGVGLTLLAAGLAVRSPLRLLLAAMGAGLTLRGLTNRTLRENARRLQRALQPSRGPRFNGQRDRVDEASWESFPASDPPSFTPQRR